MPVIRVTTKATVFKREQRQALLGQMSKEVNGETTENGPVIFEIPLGEPNKLDVLVVWEAWKDVPSELRSDIILEAYKEKKDNIAQALGVTYQEAIEQHVLPYAVQPMTRGKEVRPKELKKAMLKYGGISLDGDNVDLRFPTMALAEEVHGKLCDELPKGHWSIIQSASPIF